MCEHSHNITHHKPKEENTKKKFLGRVLGPDGSPHHISPSHIREHKEEVLGPSSWAGWLTTPHLTITHKRTQRRSSWAEFLGRMAHHTTSHHHTSQAERREHKEEVLGPSSWAGWLTTPHLTITHKRTQRRSSWAEFLGRMAHHVTHHHISPHQTSQAETSKKHEFSCKNLVQEHCRTPKSTRITTKNEHRRS